MEQHTHPENPTVKDVYDVVNAWGQQHKEDMDELRDATNHKIDEIKKQGRNIVILFAVVSIPVILNNWGLMLEQARQFLVR